MAQSGLATSGGLKLRGRQGANHWKKGSFFAEERDEEFI